VKVAINKKLTEQWG